MFCSKQIAALVFSVFVFTADALSGVTLRKIGDSIVDPAALHFTEGTWGVCVNGQSFQQDALTSFQGYQYATYYNAERQLCVARRKIHDGKWEIIRFTDYHFKGNNTHNVSVIGICERDGTIHLAFDHHGSPLHYRVSKKGVATHPKKFEWTASLFGSITDQIESGKRLERVTYPRFVRTPDGALQFGCRIGGSGNGDKFLADYDSKTGTWKNFGACFGGTGNYFGQTSRNAYLNGYTYDSSGHLHATWCWRETGNPMTNHDLVYAWSKDRGETWLSNSGNPIGKRGENLVTVESPGARVVVIPMNRGLINATTQATDSKNRIHLVTFHLPDAAPDPANWESARAQSRFFHYWRDEDARWHRREMNFIGSRPQLWFDKKDNAYLVFVGDRFNPSLNLSIAAATAKSHWSDWKIIHQETGPFSGQPQIDRHRGANILSVYVQQTAGKRSPTASALRVIEFKP